MKGGLSIVGKIWMCGHLRHQAIDDLESIRERNELAVSLESVEMLPWFAVLFLAVIS
jgi:hypothetical protein